jgi:hypothetical protein
MIFTFAIVVPRRFRIAFAMTTFLLGAASIL